MPSIKVTENIASIIQEFSCSQYVLFILWTTHKTAQQKENRIRKQIGYYNKQLKQVAAILDLDISLTSYVTRHTYGNILKQKGVDVSVISELYWHKNVNTTKHYLAKFDNKVLDRADDLL